MLITEGWDELVRSLEDIGRLGGPIKFVPNPGNPGDALIAAATWQLFDALKLSPRVTRIEGIGVRDVAIYGGGGALVPEYPTCARFIERCLEVNVRAAMVLSNSVRGHEDLLQRLDARFTIVCRDSASFAHACATARNARVLMAPDLALRLDVEAVRARCSLPSVRARFLRAMTLRAESVVKGQGVRYCRWRHALSRLQIPDNGRLDILRTDKEATSPNRGDASWDISDLYGSNFRPRSEAEFIARDMLNFVQRAEAVRTDRLHVGIAAALVGRPVTYLDNSYGKIKAIYDTSLIDVPTIAFEH
ncbi:MAG: polysaccharide pyruvyl transferase family protein [Burkholderiales bacterium]